MAMEEWLQSRTKEQVQEHYKALLNKYEKEVAEKDCVIAALRAANSRLSAFAAGIEKHNQ